MGLLYLYLYFVICNFVALSCLLLSPLISVNWEIFFKFCILNNYSNDTILRRYESFTVYYTHRYLRRNMGEINVSLEQLNNFLFYKTKFFVSFALFADSVM